MERWWCWGVRGGGEDGGWVVKIKKLVDLRVNFGEEDESGASKYIRKREGVRAYKQCVHISQHDTLQINDNRIIMNKTIIRKEYDIMNINQHSISIMITCNT